MTNKTKENIFVFVVCGEKKHINTLQFSLQYLKRFSKYQVIIVTDLSRNEIKIEYENIVNVKTPEDLDNHQASIWLKTSLHKILPIGNLYCYLDTDVIAVNAECNTIFKEFISPVTFAKDHSRLQEFSAYALNCSCLNNHQTDLKNFENAVASVIQSENFPPDYSNPNTIKLFGLLDEIKKHPFRNLFPIIRLLLCFIGIKSRIKENIVLSKKDKAFIIGDKKFHYPSLFLHRKKISRETDYKFNLLKWDWVKSDRSGFSKGYCNHLAEAIKSKFNINISEPNWRQWNGGVFLFNESSLSFMEDWHLMTNEIFTDSYWKTRDQGTLIATVWKHSLHNQPCLPESYNLLTNYKDPSISAKIINNRIVATKNNHSITPCFIHVYNEFHRKEWDIWECIEAIDSSNKNNPGKLLTPDNKIIHGLWIGHSLSKLEMMTIHSYIQNGHEFWLWIYQPLSHPLPAEVVYKDANTIIPKDKIFRYKNKNQFGHGKGSLGGFSDIFRYKLLYEHGGWWTDMDITCLKPLAFTQSYVFRTHHELKLVGNLMKCPKSSELMKICYERAIVEINAENKDWHKPIQILVDEVKNLKLDNQIMELTNSDSWDLIRTYLIKNKPFPRNWFAIHWINEEWRRNKVNKDIIITRSTFGILMNKYHLIEKPSSSISKFIYWLNLTYLVASLRQLPWFVKRKLLG